MYEYDDYVVSDIESLLGKTLSKITVNHDPFDEIVFIDNNGQKYVMLHIQDCCEQVYIEDICGDIADLIGNPILVAEECRNSSPDNESFDRSSTWTFYKLATIKGGVTIRWYGTSNGYYSENADFITLCDAQE